MNGNDWISVLLPLSQNLGLLALAALGFGMVNRWQHRLGDHGHGLCVGVLFGVVAIASMLLPITIKDGLFFDARSVLLILSAPFGGPLATVVTGIMIGSWRMLSGGAGVAPALASIGVIGVLSIVWWLWRRSSGIRFTDLPIAGALVGGSPFVVVPAFFGIVEGGRILSVIGTPIMLVSVAGTIVFGSLMLMERQRRRTETALLAERQRFRAMADSVPGAFLQCQLPADGPPAIIYAGNGIRDITGGIDAARICADPAQLDDLVADHAPRRVMAAIRDAMLGIGPSRFGLPLVGRDGIIRWAMLHVAAPQTLANGDRVADVLAIDVSDLHRTEEELRAAQVTAEQANAAKSMFLANMSHELRTPMTGVLGMLDLLDASPLNDKQQRWVTAMRRSAGGLMTLLDDILDLSKIEAGRLSLSEEPLVLDRLVGDVLGLFEGRASQKGLALTVRRGSGVPDAILADPMRLRQVLMNLVGNAIKFTDSGFIEIRLDVLAGRHGGPDRIAIAVADTGVGIASQDLAQIFDPFTQARGPMSGQPGGTGLGLAISHRLTTAMGGELSVDSLPGVGSVFTVYLPCRPVSPPVTTTGPVIGDDATALTGDRFSGRRVLVAEDNPVNRELMGEALHRMGFAVTVVEDGAAAVDISARQPFDVIIMDMQMPRMDGVAATRAIRARGDTVPIMALSADAMVENRPRYFDAGLDAFVAKPVNWVELRTTLITLLAGAPPSLPVDRSPLPPSAPTDAPSDPGVDPGQGADPLARLTAMPVIDDHRRAALDMALGADRSTMLYALFAESAIGSGRQVQAAIANGDANAYRSALHALKGLAANYGFVRLASLCASLEAMSLAEAGSLTERLDAEIHAAAAQS